MVFSSGEANSAFLTGAAKIDPLHPHSPSTFIASETKFLLLCLLSISSLLRSRSLRMRYVDGTVDEEAYNQNGELVQFLTLGSEF